ncbi:MAG: helix-turn-helix transcriptional regulator [Verrucomicrobiota bacterium]
MQGSVGQALRDARLEKKLTIDEVAHATKIRASRISDLEDDDYTHFPNIAYARSFLVLYAKFLDVDISKYPTVEVGSTVGLGDYQYLRQEEPVAPHHRARQEPAGPPEKPRWLIVFFVFLVLLVLGALAGWGIMTIRRLGSVEKLVEKNAGIHPSPAPTAAPTPTPTPTPPPPAPTPSPAAAQPQEKSLPAVPVPSPEPEIRRAEPVATAEPVAAEEPAPPAAAVPAALPPSGAAREISIRATKKIRIRVVSDNPKAPSLYFGSVNPLMKPLVFPGKHFWIKTAEPEALQVTVNGQPASGPESGVEIQAVPGL